MPAFILFLAFVFGFIVVLIVDISKKNEHIRRLKQPANKEDRKLKQQRERLIKQLMPLVNNNRAEAERLADTPRDQTITINKRD